jgi:hypothetical protein
MTRYLLVYEGAFPRIKSLDEREIGEVAVELNIFGMGDVLSLKRKFPDYSSENGIRLNMLRHFSENISNYERLTDVSGNDLLMLRRIVCKEMRINSHSLSEQVYSDLKELQKLEKQLLASGRLSFPSVTESELMWNLL